jgi:aryl-alcohol dehydrogenase-like predicted oxidoreductase
MNYHKLGQTGLKVSELCLGTMQFGWTADKTTSHAILNAAYQAGINFIDTADIYSRWVPGNPGGVSEEIIGSWIKKHQIPRDRIIVATKVRGQMESGPNDQGLSRKHIFNAVEASLKRLGTDYIDLYQAHWYDAETPIEETLTALDDLIRTGKVRYIGASNYPAWRLMQALWASDHHGLARYDSLQPHYNLVNRAEFEQELYEVCQTYGIGVIPYSPLAGGFLTGKYQKDNPLPKSDRAEGAQRKYFNERSWKILATVSKIAKKKKATPSQIALSWLLADKVITSPIIGPRTLEQLEDNLEAAKLHFSFDDKDALDSVSNWR